MMFVDLSTGVQKTKAQLIEENRNVSLPSSWTDETLAALGVARVIRVARPDVGEFEMAVKDGVEEVDGVWQEKWVKRDMFSEYSDGEGNVITVQDQKDAKTAADTATLAAAEREKRDNLLKETDYYGMSDVTMSDAMAVYRQALRDVPQQAGFPSTITWPEKP